MAPARISIIVPIYNVQDFLAECINSLLAQNHDNYEILLIDDGSTDNSTAIATEYQNNYPALCILFQKPNGGLSDARNFGIEQASGDYLMFVDSDDFLAKDTLDKLHDEINRSNADIISFGMIRTFENGTKERNIPPILDGTEGILSLHQGYLPLNKIMPNACNKLFKTSLFKQHNIRFPKGLWYEDLATIPKLFYFANSISFINTYLYHYRGREGSITSTYNPKVMDSFIALAQLTDFFDKKNALSLVQEELNRLYIRLTIVTMARVMRCQKLDKTHIGNNMQTAIRRHFSSVLNVIRTSEVSVVQKLLVVLSFSGFTPLALNVVKVLIKFKLIRQ